MTIRFILPLLLSGYAHAQVYTPPAGPAPAPAPAPTEESNTQPASKTGSQSGPLGQDLPLLDPSLSTITVGGVAIPLGDNVVLKARF